MSESRRVRRGHARLCFLLLPLLLLAFPFHRASRAGYLDLRPRFGLCVDFGRSLARHFEDAVLGHRLDQQLSQRPHQRVYRTYSRGIGAVERAKIPYMRQGQ
jgi:hypothetical protein